MKKNVLFLFGIFFVALLFGMGKSDFPEDNSKPAVVITRIDDLKGNIDIFIDGVKLGKLRPGGKFGQELNNGRHIISIIYKNRRSEIKEFVINYNRQHFRAEAFENTRPGLLPF